MRFPLPAALLAFAPAAWADAPRVVVDVAPVHSLVAQVMFGVGTPEVLLDASVSPHGWSMRPTQAALIEGADVVVWTGPGLVPALAGPVETLAPSALRLVLVEGGDHGAEHDDHDDHADAAHDHDEDHADDAADGDHAHAHGADAHFWLDPVEAAEAVERIAAALSDADPANAAVYGANAARTVAALGELDAEMEALLAPMRGEAWIVAHDAWGPLVARYGLEEPMAIHLSASGDPGAARMAELRAAASEARCAVSEPQEPARLMETVLERQGGEVARVVADPLGADVPPGPGHHATTLRNVGTALRGCLD